MTLGSVTGWAELIRLRLVLSGVLYTYIGAYLAAGWRVLTATGVAQAALVVALVIAFGNVINDWLDANADSVAKPCRPIPSGRVSRSAAGLAAAILACAAMLAAAGLTNVQIAFALCTVALSAAYSWRLKGVLFLGHGSVGLLCGSILVYGGLAAGSVTLAGLIAAVMTFLYVFAQEVLFAVMEEEEDRATNVQTTVTQIGRVNGLRLFAGLAALFAVVSVWPLAAGSAPKFYPVALIPLTILPTIGMAWALMRRPTNGTVAACSSLSRVVWYSSVASIMLLR